MRLELAVLPAVSMGAMELRLFEVLRSRPDQIVPLEDLIEAAECHSASPGTMVRIMLSRIRGRFRRANLSDPIESFYGRGYRLQATAFDVGVRLSDKSAANLALLKGELS